ncbi:hypothetical protein [Natrinema salaciae]|uniref:Uncharacterized protein n=1 Tax=Natrinema salaciae TaxID=1186196 RepID=A0A1H9JX31_9EURY|nr:hypothetical protein [Natrinema salaciae]SEQ91362.1 hypothetical protein SAMN04489841_2717 [Natrinema salaciae]
MSAYEEFWTIVCDHAAIFYLMLVAVTVMGVLNLAAMVLGDQSEGAFVVSVMVFAILGVTWVGLAVVLRHCNRL